MAYHNPVFYHLSEAGTKGAMDHVFVLDNGNNWYTIMGKADRKSQTLREKGSESGGSLEKKMAELLKDSPLVCSAFLLSGTAGCASPRGGEAEDALMKPPEGCDTFFGALYRVFFSLGALTDHLDGEITATDFLG